MPECALASPASRQSRAFCRLLSLALAASGIACSSAKSGGGGPGDGGFGFGGDSSTRDAAELRKDAASVSRDGSSGKDATPKGPAGDAACGSSGGSDWCQTNAPTVSNTSHVLCDDFDNGMPDNLFNYTGLTRKSFVNTHYLSPYCALDARMGDGGGAASSGSFTTHPYTLVSVTGGATLAFDLFVPSGAACEGAVIGRVYVTPFNAETTHAATAWLTISGLGAGNAGASVYTLTLGAQIGPDGGAAGSPSSTPVLMQVAPRAADNGWTRVELDISSYAIGASPATLTGAASWLYPGDKKAQGTSAKGSATGVIAPAVGPGAGKAEAFFDVGVIPDPSTGMARSSCELFVDDVVSNVINLPDGGAP